MKKTLSQEEKNPIIDSIIQLEKGIEQLDRLAGCHDVQYFDFYSRINSAIKKFNSGHGNISLQIFDRGYGIRLLVHSMGHHFRPTRQKLESIDIISLNEAPEVKFPDIPWISVKLGRGEVPP